jgi:hypothetical protein
MIEFAVSKDGKVDPGVRGVATLPGRGGGGGGIGSPPKGVSRPVTRRALRASVKATWVWQVV